ncbi:hypothetical protein COY17_03305 [Candidatus Saccharibacteria bacterium CG_4_10_14_0_2_um_filter_52_9]|nr:MAG: hypothetical protein COY17_03305 [Candidatus Saccharibacteria bacterium CG_4_10_14_0_2_um_filter_52_9]
MSQHLPIQIVDENDEPIGTASISEAQAKGLVHRIVRIMVEDEAGNILLQKRTPDSELYPDRWDNSAAGHVDVDESYETAAKRELAEEIGLENVELEEIGYYRHIGNFEDRKLNRFSRVFKVVVPKETKFILQPDEVASVRWFDVDEAKELVVSHPDKVTDGVADVLKRYYHEY